MKRFILLFALCQLAFGQSSNYPQVAVTPTYGTDSGSSSAYVVRSQSCPASLYTGLIVSWLPANANSVVNPTMNYCRFGAKVITKLGGNVLVANDLIPTAVALTLYDGATWQLQNPASTSVISRAVAAPSSINFGTVQSGSSSQAQSITISNTGSTQAITVVSAAFTGSTDFKSVNVSVCNGPLAAQAACVIPVFFNPSSVGAKTAALLINTDVSPQISIALSGTGGSVTTYPITVTGTDTGFGAVTSVDGNFNCVMAPPALPSGSCSVNYASGANVTFTATASVGSTFQNFNGCGLSVSPGSFTVVSPGCTVVADFSSNAPINVPSVAVAPSSINFGTQQVSIASPSQSVAISNTSGNLPLTVNSVVFSGSTDFSSSNVNICNGVLPVGATCVVPVIFTPSSAVSKTATITINTDAQGASPTVALSGVGLATPTFPLSINGGSGTGAGTVTSADGLINCTLAPPAAPSGVCSNNYASGSIVLLTATPFGTSVFNSFSGCGLTNSPGNCTVSAATTVSAVFTLPPANVNLNILGVGQGTATVSSDVAVVGGLGILNCVITAGVATSGGNSGCSGSFIQGTSINLTVAPNSSSTFVSWAGAPGCSTALTCAVIANSNSTVTATVAMNAPPPTLIQTSTNCSVSGTTVFCPWVSAQQAGDFIACTLSFPDASSTVSSFVDTKLNSYTQQALTRGTGLSQAVYYSQNIAAAAGGANTTTATLSTSNSTNIAATVLTTGNISTGGPSYVTASITPLANRLVLATFNAAGAPPGNIVSVTGNSLTWVKVASVDYGPTSTPAFTRRIETWRGMSGAPTTGAITVTYGVNVNVTWTVTQINNVNQTGTNGSGAIGIIATAGTQVNSGSSPITVTMGSFASSSNGTYAVAGVSDNSVISAPGNLTLLNATTTAPSTIDEWATGNVSPCTATFAGGGTRYSGIICMEIKIPQSRRDMRCREYAGIKTSGSPVDTSIAAAGTSAAPSSGGITTTTVNDLVTGDTASTQSVNTVSPGYIQRVKNSFGDDSEDQEGVPIGTYAFTPTLTASGNWIVNQVAWLPVSGSIPTVFSVTLLGAGNGSGTVVGNVGNPVINAAIAQGVCTGSCGSNVPASSTLTLTATVPAGSIFVNWSGVTGCSTSAVCIVPNITSNQNITANFALSGTQNYFVGGAGASDSNDGLAATVTGGHGPWLTIGHAESALVLGAGGTTVNVANGTYHADLTLSKSGTSTQRITFLSTNQYGAKITTSGSSQIISITGDWNDVQNFEIVGDSTARGNYMYGKHNRFIGNKIHEIEGNAACDSGGAAAIDAQIGADFSSAIGNIVFDVLEADVGNTTSICNHNHGIYFASQNDIIYNNLAYLVAGFGIITSHAATTAAISNNVIFNSGSYNGVGFTGGGILIDCEGTGCSTGNSNNSVDNNIIYSNFGIGIRELGGPLANNAYRNNDVFQNGGAGGNANFVFINGSCSSCLSVNPQFVNYQANGTGDYHLANPSTNPLVNGGTTLCASGISACVPLTDFSGTARPQGPAYDYGIYEQ